MKNKGPLCKSKTLNGKKLQKMEKITKKYCKKI